MDLSQAEACLLNKDQSLQIVLDLLNSTHLDFSVITHVCTIKHMHNCFQELGHRGKQPHVEDQVYLAWKDDEPKAFREAERMCFFGKQNNQL